MRDRISQLQGRLSFHGLAAAIFMHPRDVFYYAGTGQPCNLIVPAEGEPVLLARRVLEWAKADATVAIVIEGRGLPEVRDTLLARGCLTEGARLGIAADLLPATLYVKLTQYFPECKLENISPLVLDQRMQKEKSESLAVSVAATVYCRAHEVILRELHAGMTELDLAAKVSAALRQGEHEGIPRFRRWDASLQPEGLIMAGPNTWHISGHAMTVTGVGLSPSLPWGASRSSIRTGDLVVVDIGINVHGYHADIARTYVVGKADTKQKYMFEVVKEIQTAALNAIRPGVTGSEIFRVARETAIKTGVAQYFQGYGLMQGDYIGHGVGLEMDEPPTLDSKCQVIIKRDMTLAIEPKVIIPEWGAIDMEDTVHVTDTGNELLCPVPRELFEVT